MGVTPQAKLFYGYLQPESDREQYQEIDTNEEDTPWSATHLKKANGCIGGLYGYDENLGFFLAVEESLHEVEWDKKKRLIQKDFEIQPTWNEQLRQAAEEFGLDVTGLESSWYLVSLYF